MPFVENINLINTGLREYQIEVKNKIYQSWKDNNRSVMLQMPTGTGKTRLFTSIIREFINWAIKEDKETTVLLVTHRNELIEQAKATLVNHYGLQSGIIKAGYQPDPNKPVQIASIQTLNNRDIDGVVNLVIVDEAHHAASDTYKKLWNRFPNARFLGVTATPYRLNNKGLSNLFDDLITSPYLDFYIKFRYLSNIKYFAVPDTQLPDLSNIEIQAGDYADSQLMETIGQDNVIQARLVESYKKYVNGKKGIVYTINKDHNEIVKNAYNAENIPAEIVDSGTAAEERIEIIQNFKDGNIKVLINVDVFSEGFNCPDIDFVQLARPSKSLSKYLQQIGRCMRPAQGKTHGYVLDNVGMYKENGLFNKHWDWESYFYGETAPENIEKSIRHEEPAAENATEIYEADGQMMLLTNDIEAEIPVDTELSLKDFFSPLLQERFKAFLNFNYSEELVYKAIQVLHTESYTKYKEIYDHYYLLISEWENINKSIIDKEQKIVELENALHQNQKKAEELDYQKFLENSYPLLYDLFTIFLKHKGNETDALIELTEKYNEDVIEADANFKQLKRNSTHNEGTTDKITLQKQELSDLQEQEKQKRTEIEDFIQQHRGGNAQQNPDETENAEPNILASELPVNNSISTEDAMNKTKEEINKLRRFIIDTAYRYLGGKLFNEFERIENSVNNNKSLSKEDKASLRKILLRQKNKGKYSFKHNNILEVLNKTWKPATLLNTSAPNTQENEQDNTEEDAVTEKEKFLTALNEEVSTVPLNIPISNNYKTAINNYIAGERTNAAIVNTLSALNSAINKGHKINHLSRCAYYILNTNILEERIIIHLLVEVIFHASQHPVFHYQVFKEIQKNYNYTHNQVQMVVINSGNTKSHGGGFYSHRSHDLPENLTYSRIGNNIQPFIENNLTREEYENNPNDSIDKIHDQFRHLKRIQIEYSIENFFNLI